MAEITTGQFAEELTHDGFTMAVISIEYPIVSQIGKKAEKRINSFYLHHAKALVKYAKRHILPAAAAEFSAASERSAVFRPFELSQVFTVTHNGADILSLYRDIKFRAAANKTGRFAETWSTNSGWLLELSDFFAKRPNYRRFIVKQAAQIAAERQKSGMHRYHEHYPKLIKKHFSRENFYITPEGPAVFFPELSIAPKYEGIPVFSLTHQCVLHQIRVAV